MRRLWWLVLPFAIAAMVFVVLGTRQVAQAADVPLKGHWKAVDNSGWDLSFEGPTKLVSMQHGTGSCFGEVKVETENGIYRIEVNWREPVRGSTKDFYTCELLPDKRMRVAGRDLSLDPPVVQTKVFRLQDY